MPTKPKQRCSSCRRLFQGVGLCRDCARSKNARYDSTYRKERADLLEQRPLCAIRFPDICTVWATEADHVNGGRALRPACRPCNIEDGRRRAHG